MGFARYAIYYTPEPGSLADFGAAWLGWDSAQGRDVPHPDLPGLPAPVADLTARPRKYGLHGTVKPPFRLARGTSEARLAEDFATLCATLTPVTLPGLELARIGSFLALVATGDTRALSDLAATVVETLDPHRAAPTPDDLARRRKARLTPRQEALLARWGYPYTHDEFRFHMTLTGPLQRDAARTVEQALAPRIDPLLPVPFRVTGLTLVGADDADRFHQIARQTLSGNSPARA
jgi:putative phosphonate metabolism protein